LSGTDSAAAQHVAVALGLTPVALLTSGFRAHDLPTGHSLFHLRTHSHRRHFNTRKPAGQTQPSGVSLPFLATEYSLSPVEQFAG